MRIKPICLFIVEKIDETKKHERIIFSFVFKFLVNDVHDGRFSLVWYRYFGVAFVIWVVYIIYIRKFYCFVESLSRVFDRS